MGVENAVNAIKAYNQSNEELNLEALLRAALKKVRRRVLEKAQEYVKIEAGVRMDLENWRRKWGLIWEYVVDWAF